MIERFRSDLMDVTPQAVAGKIQFGTRIRNEIRRVRLKLATAPAEDPSATIPDYIREVEIPNEPGAEGVARKLLRAAWNQGMVAKVLEIGATGAVVGLLTLAEVQNIRRQRRLARQSRQPK